MSRRSLHSCFHPYLLGASVQATEARASEQTHAWILRCYVRAGNDGVLILSFLHFGNRVLTSDFHAAHWGQLHPHLESFHYLQRRAWRSTRVLQQALRIYADIWKRDLRGANIGGRQCGGKLSVAIMEDLGLSVSTALQMLPCVGKAVASGRVPIYSSTGKYKYVTSGRMCRYSRSLYASASRRCGNTVFICSGRARSRNLRYSIATLDPVILFSHSRYEYYLYRWVGYIAFFCVATDPISQVWLHSDYGTSIDKSGVSA